jgi:endonuclease G
MISKLILLIIPIIISLNLIENKNREIQVDTGIYKVLYSEELEQPKEVWYTVKCSEGKESRKGMNFYTNDSIYTSSNEDYKNNIWDKGHMAPAADFSCNKNDLKKTFSYLNCSLQHEDLNRGVWKYLENHERELSKSFKVNVHISVIFDKSCKKLPTGATIPYGYKKCIDINNKKYIYFFKNEKPSSDDYEKYRVLK